MILSMDLDGTLLNAEGILPINSREAIQRLSNEGWIIVLSTARPLFGVQQFIQELECVDFVVCCQGAHVVKLSGVYEEVLFIKEISEYASFDIWRNVENSNCELWWISKDEWYAPFPSSSLSHEESLIKHKCTVMEGAPTSKALKLMLVGYQEEIESLISNFKYDISISSSNNGLITEITAKGIDKGLSIRNHIFGNNSTFLASVGDSLNDIGMLTISDISLVVSTANEEVLAIADKVIERDDELGIVDFYSEVSSSMEYITHNKSN